MRHTDLVILSEARFVRDDDGAVWGQAAVAYEHWTKYLEVFSTVTVAARVQDAVPPPGWHLVTGADVRVAVLPSYVGPTGYAGALPGLFVALSRVLSPLVPVILRIPSPLSALAYPILRARRQPFGVEVVGDPRDVLAPGVVDHPLRPLLRVALGATTRRQCKKAAAALYVTDRILQQRYPPGSQTFSIGASDVLIDEAWFGKPRFSVSMPPLVVTVGSLDQLYKGVDVLIGAVDCLRRRGSEVHLRIVGEGRYRSELESQVETRGLGSRVRFDGQLDRCEVRAALDEADVFVLASRTEGLPRALVEAMAAGLPCLATSVGGVPELLAPEDLVSPGDPLALASSIQAALEDKQRLARMSARNLARARGFESETVQCRRVQMYTRLQDVTSRRFGSGSS